MLLGALLQSAPAEALRCVHHAYEQMALTLLEVKRGDQVVPRPAELGELDQLLNSGEGGRSVLLWSTRGDTPAAKFYLLEHEVEAAPGVREYISAQRRRRRMTKCRFAIPYTPILPGRYRFHQNHLDDPEPSPGIEGTTLEIKPGRSLVELRFKLRGSPHVARYAVRCASFEWEKSAGTCAPSAPDSPSPDSAPRPAPAPDAPPLPPSAPPPALTVEAVAPTTRGCAGCTTATNSGVGSRGALALLALLALIARRRRRRARL